MLPTKNLTFVAGSVLEANVEPDFKIVHCGNVIPIHSTVIAEAPCSTKKTFRFSDEGYQIYSRRFPIDCFIEALYCYIDKIDLVSLTHYKFKSVMDEMISIGTKFKFVASVQKFIKKMIELHSWFRGMTRWEKDIFHTLVSKDEGDYVLSSRAIYKSQPLYNWAKNSKFIFWIEIASMMCSTYSAAEEESDKNEYGGHCYSWYIHLKTKLPHQFIFDLPLDAIREIWRSSTTFWTVIMMGISDDQFARYREAYPKHDYFHDEGRLNRCERVRNGYITEREVKLLKEGVGEDDAGVYTYDDYWNQVATFYLWEKARGRATQAHADFIEHLTGVSVDVELP